MNSSPDVGSSRTVDAVIRATNADEFASFTRFAETPYAHVVPDDVIEAWRQLVDYDRFLVAELDHQIIATAGALGFDLALPGGTLATCAGITAVAVRPDHRRRGLLRRLMTVMLEDAASRGEPFAALFASESAIYGRFGFGAAIPTVDLAVDRSWVQMRRHAPDSVQMIDAEEAVDKLAPIREALRPRRHGMFSRSDAAWNLATKFDPESEREGAGPRQIALVADRGYVIWRIKPDWQSTGPDGTVIVEELVALDADAAASLWSFVVSMDLCSRVIAKSRPVDEPLGAMIVDGSRVAMAAGTPVYLRLIDVVTALEARRYRGNGRVVLQVTDEFLPEQAGTYLLEISRGVGHAQRISPSSVPNEAASLRLDTEDLAATYLGGVRVTTLVGAGRVSATDEAASAFDHLFATAVAPWHDSDF